MVALSGIGGRNATDIVVAAAGRARPRARSGPLNDVVDKLLRETTGTPSRRAKKAAGTAAR